MKTELMPVVVQKVYDFLLWVMQKLVKFPKDQRYLLAQRIENGLLDILEMLIEATLTKEKAALLRKANLKLETFRFLMRISYDRRYIDIKAYEFQARVVNEIGRMIGGWLKQAG